MLYERVGGARLFRGATTAETLTAIIRDEPEALDRSVPAPLRWIIERCLAKDPDARYASTKDLARDLKSARDHLSDVAVAIQPIRKRWPIVWMLLALTVAAAMFFAGKRTGRNTPPEFK